MEDTVNQEVRTAIEAFTQPYVNTIDLKQLNMASVGGDNYRVDCYIYTPAPAEYYLDKVYGIGKSWYVSVVDGVVTDRTLPSVEDISFKGIADIARGY